MIGEIREKEMKVSNHLKQITNSTKKKERTKHGIYKMRRESI